MHSISLLVDTIQKEFPHLQFVEGHLFSWSPETATISYDKNSEDIAALLHEVAHADLAHTTYSRDMTLIEMERDAWTHTRTILAPRYEITIPEDTIEDSLDTYREWLHARSTCPACGITGIQADLSTYNCLACNIRWHVNEARACGLRRSILKT
jgi:hypothetical protein